MVLNRGQHPRLLGDFKDFETFLETCEFLYDAKASMRATFESDRWHWK
jgi:hypothetical protein